MLRILEKNFEIPKISIFLDVNYYLELFIHFPLSLSIIHFQLPINLYFTLLMQQITYQMLIELYQMSLKHFQLYPGIWL